MNNPTVNYQVNNTKDRFVEIKNSTVTIIDNQKGFPQIKTYDVLFDVIPFGTLYPSTPAEFHEAKAKAEYVIMATLKVFA